MERSPRTIYFFLYSMESARSEYFVKKFGHLLSISQLVGDLVKQMREVSASRLSSGV